MRPMLKPYVSPYLHNPGNNPHYTRTAWHRGTFNAAVGYGFKRVPCEYLNDEFCVHHHIDTRGFGISYAPAGFMILSRDRVFRTMDWAKHVAEKLYPITNNWGLYADGSWPFPDSTVKMWNYIFDVAEVQGAFRNELIRPSDRITHARLEE